MPVSFGCGLPQVERGLEERRVSVETIGALIGCGVALAIGLALGYRWTLGPPWHLIAGVVVGEVCAAVYFAVANWVGRAGPACSMRDRWA